MDTENTISFTFVSAEGEYLNINLTKYVQDIHEKNCKTAMKEMTGLNNSEKFCVHG